MKMTVLEVELTAEQRAELDAAKDNPGVVETIMSRIAEEVIAQQEEKNTVKGRVLEAVHGAILEVKLRLLQDVILNAHVLLHTGEKEDVERALGLICPTAAIIEGERLPVEVIEALTQELDALNAQREKASCKGQA